MKKICELLDTARDWLPFLGKWALIIVLWLMFVVSFTNNDKDPYSGRRYVETHE